MERFSHTIESLYQKYLPLALNSNISFNLDFPDTSIEVKDIGKIIKNLEKILKSSFSRAKNGSLTISIQPSKIIIKYTGVPLSKTECDAFSNDFIKFKSRIGFGTEVTLNI